MSVLTNAEKPTVNFFIKFYESQNKRTVSKLRCLWLTFVFYLFQSAASEDNLPSNLLYSQCSKTLDVILKLRPESIVDGFMNIWIIKPGSSSRGRGISLDMRLENIVSIVNKSSGHQGRYIVQKYIERPFLIYETKFDIRQWFLVTSWNPLNVWMYRDSYLRWGAWHLPIIITISNV